MVSDNYLWDRQTVEISRELIIFTSKSGRFLSAIILFKQYSIGTASLKDGFCLLSLI